MAAARKVQGEINQCLKKVEEGVQVFDDIWDKVYSAGQQKLKEKYEGDLKSEIKKLQRFRDTIKGWLGSNEIKDKTQLTEARIVIEKKMEQFKICEKDTKTKAFSKAGLERQASTDPKEAEREEKREWVNSCLERLQDLVDLVDGDVQKLTVNAKGKGKNKEQLEKLDNRIQKNKWHMARLEQILKLLDNEEMDPSDLDAIKDDVEYYIESAAEDDGTTGVSEEFDIYEELNLGNVNVAGVGVTSGTGDTDDEDGGGGGGGGDKGDGDAKTTPKKVAAPGVAGVTAVAGAAGIAIGKLATKPAPGTPIATAAVVPGIAGAKGVIPTAVAGAKASVDAKTLASSLGMGIGAGASPAKSVAPVPTAASVVAGSTSAKSPLATLLKSDSKKGDALADNKDVVAATTTTTTVAPTSSWAAHAASTIVGAPAKPTMPAITPIAAVSSLPNTSPPLNPVTVPSSSSGTMLEESTNSLLTNINPGMTAGGNVELGQLGVNFGQPNRGTNGMAVPGMTLGSLAGGSIGPLGTGTGIIAGNDGTTGLTNPQGLPINPAPQQPPLGSSIDMMLTRPSQQQQQQQLGQIPSLAQVQLQQQQQQQQQQLSAGNLNMAGAGATSQMNGMGLLQQQMGSGALSNVAQQQQQQQQLQQQQLQQQLQQQQLQQAQQQLQQQQQQQQAGLGGGRNMALSAEVQFTVGMLKMSAVNAPDALESDRLSSYVPRNPYATNPSFPSQPPAVIENAALYERLPADSLFFAFYHQQATYQQFLAAKQLKKLSWRFHKKYMTWFQRHEEPKVTTDDYEEGTYVYFDYESGWTQRLKDQFKFEYSFLEDS